MPVLRRATRSILEDLLFDHARTETWQNPEINATAAHGTHIAFENDREIQLTLQAAGHHRRKLDRLLG